MNREACLSVLLLPLALLAWAILSAWAADRLVEAVAHTGDPRDRTAACRAVRKALLLLALLPLPLIDELLARPQFEALCQQQAALARQPQVVTGRLVHRVELPGEPVPGLMLPVRAQRQLYLDDATREPLASFSTLQAGPGKLARLTGHRHGPLTFAGTCSWASRVFRPQASAPPRPSPPSIGRGRQVSAPDPIA